MVHKKKGALLAFLAGTMFAFGGCLDINWQKMLWDTALYAGQEFLLDNDNILDLFPDA